jgi:hypothetical protein
MRPLIRPDWRAEWREGRPSDVLLDALGRFCAACERRLPQDAVAWHVTREEPIEEVLTADDWPQAIPLCHNCAFAAQQSPTPVDELLLPHHDLTFTLGPDSPLAYTRPNAEERVIAEPRAESAEATAGYFALNDHVPALGGELPVHEDADLLTRDWVDPRLELRTRAWDVARTAGEQIAGAPPEQRELVLTLCRTLASDTGFWSTWATVLWSALADREALVRVLQPPVADDNPALPPDAAGPQPFPATRPDWLPPPEAARGG